MVNPESSAGGAAEINELCGRIEREMKNLFADDGGRINHALKVLDHAETILRSEPGSPLVVRAAAILHDIGIHEAERKHGSAAARFQEIEGPPIARAILEKLGLDAADVDHVCRIVGSHHSARDIDTPEFRIIWDSDWLVNIPGELREMSKEKLPEKIRTVFRTPTGRDLALKVFGCDGDAA